MKTIKSVLEKQIGFFSFLLAFIVFYSGSVRGLLASDLSSPEIVHLTQSSKDQSDLHQQQATIFNAISEVETVESEIDEVQFDYIFSKSVVFTFFSSDNPSFKQFLEGVQGRKLHLYDLYCNWKIHLS